MLGNCYRIVNFAHRQNANRASGTVNQLNVRRQNIVQPIPVNRVGVTATNFHDAETASFSDALYLTDNPFCQF
jgi:shikimate kinase